MNRISSFLSLALLLGTLGGLAAFGYVWALYQANALPLGTRRHLGMVLMWVAMGVALWLYTRRLGRPLHFLEGLGLCLLTLLVASLVEGGLVHWLVTRHDPALVPAFVTELKRLAALDHTRMKEQFGNNPNAAIMDYEAFLKQIDRISPESIFWFNFQPIRWIFHFLYAALLAVWFRRRSFLRF